MANYNTAFGSNTALGFKSGVQNDLNKYLIGGEKDGQAAEGVFYLTTDTHRLYIGRKSLEDQTKIYPVPVNQGILPVDSLEDLKDDMGDTGEFYYIKGSNILCIKSGGQWIQINPDTDTKVEDFEASIEATTSNSAKILHTIETNDDSIDPFKTEFSIVGGSNITVTADNVNKSITISTPDDNDTTIDSIAAIPLKGSTESGATEEEKKTGYNIKITDSEGGSKEGSFLDPEVKYGKDKASSAKFRDNILTLDVYTTNEVDNLLKTADALVFRGIIEDYSRLPSDNVQNGDTYKVGTQFTHEGTTYKVGDILIAHGEETNDYLTEPDWIHIPAGDEVYTSGTLIDVNPNGTINHKSITTNHTGGSIEGFTFNVIDSITTSDGHVTDYTTKNVTVQLIWDTF